MRKLFVSLLVLALGAATAAARPQEMRPAPIRPLVVYGEAYRSNLAHIRACEESLATPDVVRSMGFEVAEEAGGTVEARALAALGRSPRVIAIAYHPFTVYLLTERGRGRPSVRAWRVATPANVRGESSERRKERLAAALRRTLARVERMR